ncbi:PREDICTED: GRIP and coiled-coil domain-containing protein 2-like [Acropora digitifera]|uniref:GRIP and coiled-coil domain-containing protein 2-like n=1 Tax=Acropora digitifera TaxID=70779 RepID=UPI00077A50C1|nr:PREDICTED: GRIP and coiled-coil domain-containing protein 2-like [Acropora digitifera]
MKLKEENDKCNTLQADFEELESEHEKLTARHSKLIQDIDNKEAHWKDRFERLRSERTTTNEEHLEAIRHMTLQNESVAATFKEKLDVEKEEHRAQLDRLQQKLTDAESRFSRLQQENQQQATVRSRSPPDLALNLTRTEERRPGEGMDQSELAQTDTAANVGSAPSTPITPSIASTLEKILSPTVPKSPVSPGSDEGLRGPPLDENLLLSNISTANKKVEHLSEVGHNIVIKGIVGFFF